MGTGINWCDETLNPVVGCSWKSKGCDNCYAQSMARRLAAMGREQYQQVIYPAGPAKGKWNRETAFVPSELEKPYKWKKPRTIFVSSMGDLFHESVPFDWVTKVMHSIHHNPRHTFIFLTKRPANMQRYFDRYVFLYGSAASNLILGVSVEDQATADERIPVLLQIPAAKRFVSLEPMIGPVNLNRIMVKEGIERCDGEWQLCWDALTGFRVTSPFSGTDNNPYLDGVILGGESGPKARPLDPAWVRLVRDQCEAAGVPFMFKQWGSWIRKGQPYQNRPWELTDDKGFPLIDGRTHTELAWSVKK